jgi:hypothetical protein
VFTEPNAPCAHPANFINLKSDPSSDLPTTPDPSTSNPGGGPHLPTMPDPAHDPEKGQRLPTDPDPVSEPVAIRDPLPSGQENIEKIA